MRGISGATSSVAATAADITAGWRGSDTAAGWVRPTAAEARTNDGDGRTVGRSRKACAGPGRTAAGTSSIAACGGTTDPGSGSLDAGVALSRVVGGAEAQIGWLGGC